MNASLPTPKSLKFIYFRYKDSSAFVLSVVSATIVISIILILEVLLPQINNWFSIQQEVDVTKQQTQVLSNNINFIGSMDDTTLNQDLQTVTTALPADKSFIGILNAISDAAIRSNIVLNDYSFNLGTIQSDKPILNQQTFSPIQITLVVEGNLTDITTFLKQVESRIPLAKVESMSFSHGSATIILTYYYKPFPNISFDDNAVIQPLSTDSKNLIKKLNTWTPTAIIETAPSQQASYSADPFD